MCALGSIKQWTCLRVSCQKEGKTPVWCKIKHMGATVECPVIFKANTAFPRPCVAFLFSGGKLLDSEEMASLLFGSAYFHLCPPTRLFWLEICLKAFHNLYGMKIFIIIAEIGTKGWATTDCFCKALSGCFLGIGWASGGEGHNCRARRDQATGFAVNILNRKQRREEVIANHPAKLHHVLKEMMCAMARKILEGQKARKQ